MLSQVVHNSQRLSIHLRAGLFSSFVSTFHMISKLQDQSYVLKTNPPALHLHFSVATKFDISRANHISA